MIKSLKNLFVIASVFILITFLSIKAQTLVVSPKPMFMGKIPLGSSAVRDISIQNASGTNASISKIEITGPNANNFEITNNPGSASLGPLEELVLNIKFSPSNGGDLTSMLNIKFNAGTVTDSLIAEGAPVNAGQITFERVLGTSEADGLGEAIQTSDDGFLLVGNTLPLDENYSQAYVIKTDQYGEEIWSDTYGGKFSESASDAVETDDGGYLIIGGTSSYGAGNNDAYLAKYDKDGNQVWTKTYGGQYDDGASMIIKSSDGNYIIGGTTEITSGGEGKDAWIIKIDGSGNKIWDKNYGGEGGQGCSQIINTSDNGFIFVGSTQIGEQTNYDIYVVKLETSGTVQWSKKIDAGNWEQGASIAQLSDDSYIIGGLAVTESTAQDAYLLKLSSDGTKQWDKRFGGEHNDSFNRVIPISSGGYLAAGKFTNYFSVDFIYTDIYVVRTDENGNKIWENMYGGDKSESTSSLIQANDGAFLIGGNSSSYSKDSDFYILKINENGAITSINNKITKTIPEQIDLSQNYPNPFNGQTIIKYSINDISEVSLKIFNVVGQEVYNIFEGLQQPNEYQISINAEGLPSGVYFYQLRVNSNIVTKRMILLK